MSQNLEPQPLSDDFGDYARAPTTRETADHAELAAKAERCTTGDPWYKDEDLRGRQSFGQFLPQDRAFIAAANPATVMALLSEIAALRGDLTVSRDDLDQLQAHFRQRDREATQAERQRDELRKAADTAANLFKLCTEPTMFENASTLNVYAQMTEWLVRNRPLIATRTEPTNDRLLLVSARSRNANRCGCSVGLYRMRRAHVQPR